MSSERRIPLDRIRTDGWFERLSESIGSFHTLCDVLGDRFFALALVVGARVSSLMIDRFNPDQSVVEFSFVGLDENDEPSPDENDERLTVVEFRRRLVDALQSAGHPNEPLDDEAADDPEALQRHIGPRTLLLAPLYGYRLDALVAGKRSTALQVYRHGQSESYDIDELWRRLLAHVDEDLERGVRRDGAAAIDLNSVAEAEAASAKEDWKTVVDLLGGWPLPLAFYWRTPEGQLLPEQQRQRIAEGLGLLGAACAELGDAPQGEEVLRLAVQYAQDGAAAPTIFHLIGRRFIESERPAEAIGPLRRAHTLGGADESLLVELAGALLDCDRVVGALGCLWQAEQAGLPPAKLKKLRARATKRLGAPAKAWRKLVERG